MRLHGALSNSPSLGTGAVCGRFSCYACGLEDSFLLCLNVRLGLLNLWEKDPREVLIPNYSTWTRTVRARGGDVD